jgi:hypothetical protein
VHPILLRGNRLGLYLAAWLPLAGLLTLAYAWVASGPWAEAALVAVFLTTVFAFLSLAAWYPCRALPIERTRAGRVVVTHVLGALLSSSLWIAVGRTWVFALERGLGLAGAEPRFTAAAPSLFATGAILYLLVIALHYLAAAITESRQAERRALELRALAREAELRALRAQLDPHFLFNSLNSVSALIPSDPAAARSACLRLSEFLRDSLRLGGLVHIPLDEELHLVRSFLAVEQVRLGPRLAVDERVEAAAGACLVPPLLLQPLVENAIRHGISQLVAGGTVRLEAARRGARLAISIVNPCDPERPQARASGLGLGNARARLQALYGGEAWLEAAESEGRFRVEVFLPALERAAQEVAR